ncbi:hypothetical protein BGZ83_005448, partial [Gryganskiella cystojenkinii]
MDRAAREPTDLPFIKVMEHLTGLRRLMSSQASSVSQTRLDNLFRQIAPSSKERPQVSPESAPYLVDNAVAAAHLATLEASKRLWNPAQSQSETGSS